MGVNMRMVAVTQRANKPLKQTNDLCKIDWSGPCQSWYFPWWVLVKQLSGWHTFKKTSKGSFVECSLPTSSALRNSQWGDSPLNQHTSQSLPSVSTFGVGFSEFDVIWRFPRSPFYNYKEVARSRKSLYSISWTKVWQILFSQPRCIPSSVLLFSTLCVEESAFQRGLSDMFLAEKL